MIRYELSSSFLVSLAALCLAASIDPVAAQTAASSVPHRPAFVDERRLPGAPSKAPDQQQSAEEEARRAVEEARKRIEEEAAALRAELEAAAVAHKKRLEAEAAAHSQRLAAEAEARRAEAEAARKAEEQRQAKTAAEQEDRRRAEEEAARKAEEQRQAKAAAEQEDRRRAEAEAARKAEELRQAAAVEEQKRRKALNITGNPADGLRYLQRGRELLANGDFASARLFLERASDNGNADAALLLGETFDTRVLPTLGAMGVTADAALARRWYQRAAALGSSAAAERLKRLSAE
ncbi:MAG: hypothetical protein R3D44_13215 [Hyphomicrobiaceae bacterium]